MSWMELETLLLFLLHLDSARVYWMSGVWDGKRSAERMNGEKGLVEEARLGQREQKTTCVGAEMRWVFIHGWSPGKHFPGQQPL